MFVFQKFYFMPEETQPEKEPEPIKTNQPESTTSQNSAQTVELPKYEVDLNPNFKNNIPKDVLYKVLQNPAKD